MDRVVVMGGKTVWLVGVAVMTERRGPGGSDGREDGVVPGRGGDGQAMGT
jgi:hypothetical protein